MPEERWRRVGVSGLLRAAPINSLLNVEEQERAREEGAKEMSGEERMPEKRWRRVGVSGSLRAAPINSRMNVVVRSPTPFGLGQNGCWASRGFQLPRPLPQIGDRIAN